jgi:hypothetical protein
MTLPIGQVMNFVEPRRQLWNNLPKDELEGIVTSIDPSMVLGGISDLRERRRRNKQEQEEPPFTLQPTLTNDTFTPSTSTFTQTNAVAPPQLTINS